MKVLAAAQSGMARPVAAAAVARSTRVTGASASRRASVSALSAAGGFASSLAQDDMRLQFPTQLLSRGARRVVCAPPAYAKPALCCEGSFWVYGPGALEQAPVEPRSQVVSVKFRLWKQQGYVYCQTDSMDYCLKLPVFKSDGCGYPALSFVLRSWMERDNERWGSLKDYLAGFSSCDDVMQYSFDGYPRDSWNGRNLDMRYDQADVCREWLFVSQHHKLRAPGLRHQILGAAGARSQAMA